MAVPDSTGACFNKVDLESWARFYIASDLPLLVPDIDQAARIGRRSKNFCRKVIFLERADRLMLLAKQAILLADSRGRSYPPGHVWWALRLYDAKGRMGRHWWAARGGIYLCLALFQGLLPENLHLYNIAAGLSIAQVLREWGVNAHIRWLNDIMLNHRKLAGILAETFTTPRLKEQYLLLGVGINVNQEHFPRILRTSSTSLFLETGMKWPVFSIGTHVLSRMALNFAMLHDWEAQSLAGDLPLPQNPVINAYRPLARVKGKRVRYGRDLEKGKGSPGTALDILPDGRISLLMDDGTRLEADTGEIRYEDAPCNSMRRSALV